jgi:chromosome segregation ATPase
MSSEQYQRTVNSLDKEIADLEKKKAAKDKEVATLQGKINTLKKSINSHTSASTLNNKMRQIATHESDQAKKSQDSAELGKRLPKSARSVLKPI